MKTLSSLTKSYIKELNQLRSNQLNLADYLYSEKKNLEGISFDKNLTKRYRMIIALLIDKNSEDESLIKALFKAEIREHERNADQGLSPSMSRNAFLLAGFNNVKHLELFIKANTANYDTYYEFNEKFLLWNGIKKSYKQIEKLNKKSQEFFYQKLGKTSETCIFTDDDIQHWKTKLSNFYSTFFKNENYEDEFYLLLDLEEKKSAQKLLASWKKKQALIKLSETQKDKLHYTISLGDIYFQQGDKKGLWTCIRTYFKMQSLVKKLSL